MITMKKFSLLLSVVALIGFVGCTNVIGNQEGDKSLIDNQEGKAHTTASVEAEPEYLTYDTFIEKVWNFEENPQEWVYEGDVPCVIDFYADWCKPCRMVAPIMDDLAKEYDGKVKIYKVDVDKEKQLAAVFQVRSIPAVLFSPVKGRPMMQAGALPKDQYVKIIEDNLLNTNQ
jgi:thioredoxin